ncbi:MAG: peptide-methionine (S)-S-oxide reductase MsrA [Caldicoprobacterales bacterium]|jgi:peptide-methionine (S)-S-oxide reductase|nr:peptide-methionine (S)-S-oxide reductase MsrA [Clostridiales bacterium]
MKEIVFAGGCFWGVEEYFSRIPGVLETMVGYANGHLDNPSYEQVCAGNTGHAEACLIKYDQTLLSLEELLKRYWLIVDPTVKDRQGPDVGNQYRTGIYYLNDSDLPVIQGSLDEEQKKYKQPIVTEVSPLDCFYPAEDYHQKYLKKNPGGYCHIDFSKLTLPGD